jgi:hypothetical protein
MAENGAPASKGNSDNPGMASAPSGKSSKDGKNTDGLLDVFTSEELTETAFGLLGKDLGDLSMSSLLEESRQLAEEIRRGH